MISRLKAIGRPALKRAAITAGLEASAVASFLGAAKAARGRGAIFTLHHVRPETGNRFQPNSILDITPEFLETTILTLKAEGYVFVRLEEIANRLDSADRQPFACFTLDDGYKDNAEFAAPVFSRHQVPFTIFITKGFIEATHSMWWETLDALLNQHDSFEFDFGNGIERVSAASRTAKLAAFERLAAHVNTSDEAEAVARIDVLARSLGLEPLALTRDLTMRAQELEALADNPLVSYGAHTVSHRALARLTSTESQREIVQSIVAVAEITGLRPASFAYPYGHGRSVSPRERTILRAQGIRIAVTTRPGILRPDMTSDMTAIPRISLNGLYQKARYVRALASGLPFKVMG